MQNNANEPWHLDKRVPVALIVTLCVQTAGVVYWAAGQSYRTDALEKQVTNLISSAVPNVERLVRVEEQVKTVNDNVIELKNILRERPIK